jgi:multidrug efflux pump subunit AcrB
VIAFLIGCMVSLVAAVPALLMARGGKQAEFNTRLKLWAIGVAIRFGIIGAALFYLFTRTDLDRIPTLIGVVVTYFLIFILEARSTLRS